VNQTAETKALPDLTAPGSITNLQNTTQPTSITWTWDDPSDADFAKVMVYLDGVFKENVTKVFQNYTASSLSPSTPYTIGTRTVDDSDNVNTTWVNQTAVTQATGETGSLYIVTYPPDADILIDGTPSGKTNAIVSGVQAGPNRNVTLIKDGYKTETRFVNVPAGGLNTLSVTLIKGEGTGTQTGTLYIVSYPPKANILIDGTYRGQTNDIVHDVAAGPGRNVTLIKEGYEPETRFVDVPAGGLNTISITLYPV
jgi:hypothetical protein